MVEKEVPQAEQIFHSARRVDGFYVFDLPPNELCQQDRLNELTTKTLEGCHKDEASYLYVTFECIDKLCRSKERARQVKEGILELLCTPEMQRLKNLSQLGMIKRPIDIREGTIVRHVAKRAGLLTESNTNADNQDTDNGYLGGKRFEHVLLVAALEAMKCVEMKSHNRHFSEKTAVNMIVAGLQHDAKHSVLSHKGQQAIDLVLTDKKVLERTPAEVIRIAKLSHEERVIELIRTKYRNIYDKYGFDVDEVTAYIAEEKTALQDVDTMSYLWLDTRNWPGDTKNLKISNSLIKRIISSARWDSKNGEVFVGDDGYSARQALLWIRYNAYKEIYRDPETTRMEVQIATWLAKMVHEGQLSLEELLIGDDNTIQEKAKKIALGDKVKYGPYLDALKGITFPHVRAITAAELNETLKLSYKDGVMALKKKISALLLENEGIGKEQLNPDDWFIIFPYPYDKKKLHYGQSEVQQVVSLYIGSGTTLNEVVLCFNSNVKAETREKVERLLSRTGRAGAELEFKVVLRGSDESILNAVAEMNSLGRFAIQQKTELFEMDKYVYFDEETKSYLRLRQERDKSTGKTKYILAYKRPGKRVNISDTPLLDRDEIEYVFEDETSFFEASDNPSKLYSSTNDEIRRIMSIFEIEHKGVTLRQLGFVINRRTKIIVAEGAQKTTCELDLDRLIYYIVGPQITAFPQPLNDCEIEVEQNNMSDEALAELIRIVNGIASLGHVIDRTQTPKVLRMLRQLGVKP